MRDIFALANDVDWRVTVWDRWASTSPGRWSWLYARYGNIDADAAIFVIGYRLIFG